MSKRTWTDSQLIEAVSSSDSLAEVLRFLGLRAAGGNHKLIKGHIVRLGLPTNFTYTRQKTSNSKSDKDLFIEGSTSKSHTLISRLLKLGVAYQCVNCANEGFHNGFKLILQLDHINGRHDDNRRVNLRLLCPNCHSQTATYAGRKVKDTFKQKAKKPRPRKVNYDDVSRRVTDLGNLSAVAREFNITETAVRKIMKKTTLSHSGVV